MTTDMAWAAIPLPDDVAQHKAAGFLDDCRAAIHTWLSEDIPDALRRRLELELERLPFLPESEYPYTDQEALALLDQTFSDFQPRELTELVNSRAADWLYIRGIRRFHRRFVENIITTRPDYAARQKIPTQESLEDRRREARIMENIAIMKERGGRSAKLTIRANFWLEPDAVREGQPLTVHLPIPRECAHQSDIQILKMSHPEGAVIAPPDAPQRTVCYPSVTAMPSMSPACHSPAPSASLPDRSPVRFFVEYSFVNALRYVNPDPAQTQPGYPDEAAAFLGEEAPHVLFTPYMKALLAEIQGAETDPLKVARAIYNFVTTKIRYSYMREYAVLDTICDYAAKNLKGDCGVQAILFITLCRLAGIPARWQSGLAADPEHIGCHDWAEFYVNPFGWLYADPSYGGSAFRAKNFEKWNYYFGNLDIYRMVANSAMQSDLLPPKIFFRADPTDNQRGEAEYPDGGVLPFQFRHEEEMIDFQEL